MAFHDMKINKRKNFNIDVMLAKLSKARTLQSDGSISLPSFGALDEFESYLRTAIEIEGKTDAFIRNVVKKAMHTDQELTEGKFLDQCQRIANNAIKNEQKRYKVLFPIWGSISSLSGRRVWDDVSITFDIKRCTRFARRAVKDREKQLSNHNGIYSKSLEDFNDLPLALCSVKGIDLYDAFEKAENAISRELGLYSFSSPRGKYIFFSNKPDNPINTILLAPHMTVHNENGALSADIYWYNQWSNSLAESKQPIEKARIIEKNAQKLRSRLKNLPWRPLAEIALRRYYSAFSQCDLESSFLDGWRLLEAVGGHPSEKSETLVKRAAWFFENRDEQYQVGLHLMER